jgi:CubicO group peptidase (beta-lactamase class C family)
MAIEGICESRFAAVRRCFEAGFESGEQLGAAVSFVLDGEPVVDLWGGWLDKEHTRPWEPDTLVNVYSTTKGMTAICAHQLIERGELDLDAPVARYWPEFANNGKEEIPVRWLLSHRAGLSGLHRPISASDLYAWTPMIDALAAETPWWEPGTKHGYHALTFGHLVGELIRRVSRKSVGAFFRENVADPLEADFHIGLEPEHDARTAHLFGTVLGPAPGGTGEKNKVPDALAEMMASFRDPTTVSGAAFALAGMDANSREWRAAEIPAANGHGTARAIARIYGALARGGEVDGVRILQSASIERATEEQAFGPDAVLGGMPMRFGLGFMLRHDFMPLSPSNRAFGHPGAGGSIGMADPDAGVGFGFTLNKMQMGMVGAAGAFAMLEAFYDAL